VTTIAPREPPNYRRWIARQAWHLAVADIGQGEIGANNSGPWLIEKVRPNDGTGGAADTGGPWCASWVSYCYWRALRQARAFFGLELQLGFKTSRSALQLGNRMKATARVVTAQEARDGDLFFKEREGGGHVGFVRAALAGAKLPSLEGNVGKYPALVAPLWQRPRDLLYVVRYD
jgi:hypothetical protein